MIKSIPKYTFDERVCVCDKNYPNQHLRGRCGYVRGISKPENDDDDPRIAYSVVFENARCSYFIYESLLSPCPYAVCDCENCKIRGAFTNQKFDFYEIVVVQTNKPSLMKINGQMGYIKGKLCPEDYLSGDCAKISYGVWIESEQCVWDIPEEDLVSTGEFIKIDGNGPTVSVRVGVDTKGRGILLDKETITDVEIKALKKMGWM